MSDLEQTLLSIAPFIMLAATICWLLWSSFSKNKDVNIQLEIGKKRGWK